MIWRERMSISRSSQSFSDNVKFIAEAERDLERLDGSSLRQLAKAINKVAANPAAQSDGGFGKPLRGGGGSGLAGFNKIKLKKLGLRVVYKTINQGGEMLVIIIAARADGYVYSEAERRIAKHGLR